MKARRGRAFWVLPAAVLPSALGFGILIMAEFSSAVEAAGEPLVVAEGGRSEYVIVIGAEASASTRYAADELQKFLKESSGATLPIVSDAEPAREREILVGASARLKALGQAIDFGKLGDEGYVIRTVGPRLVIAGSAVRGTLYGVYGFLDEQMGCRWFTPKISRIPKRERVAVGPLDATRSAALAYREVMLWDCWEADWLARNRVNTTKLLDARHGGAMQFVPGYYVHTFKGLVPPEKYYEGHPEYYSEVDGKRLREGGQLCATNDEVARIVTERVRELLRGHPEARVISVSQNDANKNYCRCARCAALDEQEGTHAAQVLCLVNRVAEGIEKEFPDRAVETLAYEWSRQAPKSLKPRDNVIVRLSTIRCSFSEPIERSRGGANAAFREDLEAWAKVCKRLWIWDYTTYFSYYLLPWPNYRVIDDNLRYFEKNNVRGVVEESDYQSPGSDMAGLKGYLCARFLWDAELDEDRTIDEYLEGVYGPAAPHIRAYLDLLAEKVAKDGVALPIYGSRTPPYLTLEVLREADGLWEKAAAAVADQPDVARRVALARLGLDYAFIEHYRFKPGEMVQYEGDPRRGKVTGIDAGYAARIRRFLETSKGSGITHIREGEADFDEYVKWLQGLLAWQKE